MVEEREFQSRKETIMNMQEVVRSVLNGIDKGLVFDAHFVIAQIINHKKHSDVYIHFAKQVETTAHMHSRIAKLIGKSGLAKPLSKYKSLSNTIHGTPGKCSLWQKI